MIAQRAWARVVRPLLLTAPTLLAASPSVAAPPVGWSLDPESTTAVAPRAAAIPAAADTGTTSGDPVTTGPGDPAAAGTDIASEDPAAANTDTAARGGDPLTACPPETPYQLSPTLCVDQTLIDQIEAGWQVHIDPAGNVTLIPPPFYNPDTGQWGNFDPATQGCDPNIAVKLKEAALAGSQLTRAISDRQMDYPQTDPIEIVNNPRQDGAGGVCTIDIFAFDLGRLLGSTYEQIRNLIEALSHLSVDALFGAGCQVVNTIFGDLQHQLLQDLLSHSPLTGFQQFLNTLRVGTIAPLTSFTRYGNGTRASTATVPGMVTTNPLQVSYVPGKGYVYGVDLGGGNVLVVTISQTPLVPADAVAATR